MARIATSDELTREELALATRNAGMPLEALRWAITPVGLHYLLIHYDIPAVDPGEWALTVDGLVDRPLRLTIDDLRERDRRTLVTTMECAGNGRVRLSPRPISQPWNLEAVGTAAWAGVPLRPLLEEAGVADGAVEVVFTGLDRGVEGDVEQAFARSLPLAEAMRDDVLLADEINGGPLPPQHGYPLRLVVPGWYGMTNVKWLARVTVVDEPFDGYQQAHSYRVRQADDEAGEPLTRMAPRALMVPPGIPEFLSRRRVVQVGRHRLEGRAWSGWAPVTAVEVSDDGGATWQPAVLDDDGPGFPAWRHWALDWDAAAPGEVELWCRATDAAGHAQPVDAPWNLGGYANNSVQRVPVTVVEGTG